MVPVNYFSQVPEGLSPSSISENSNRSTVEQVGLNTAIYWKHM